MTVVRLEALAHELVNDDPLMLDLGKPAYGAGTVDGSFAIKVRDTTVKRIAPKPDVAVKETCGGAVAAAAGSRRLEHRGQRRRARRVGLSRWPEVPPSPTRRFRRTPDIVGASTSGPQ